jgi:hypothetical protein
MSHFAKIDENGNVLHVIVAEQDYINTGQLGDPKSWIQTSYNSNIRKNFAGVGYKFDKDRDAFIPKKTYESWVLNEDTCTWEAPKKIPLDGKYYDWNESKKDWEVILAD